MRYFGPVVLAWTCLQAQGAGPGFVRGVVLQADTHEISIRSNPGDIYRFSLDSRTWIERARERIPASAIRQGDFLEVVSDRDARVLQYARMIHVLDRATARPRRRLPVQGGADMVTYSGVTVGAVSEAIVLRTQMDGVQSFSLIPDTEFISSGVMVGRTMLEPQTHVLVRAIKMASGEMEAYQVIWGELLKPDRN